MPYTIKRLLVGKAKRTAQAAHERLTKKTGLAVFASDALSSTAYATEEILLVLAVAYAAQANSFNYVVPITFGIVIVLTIVAISYRQTIFAYPSGGGAYIVAKENLGTMPGLVAGAALLVDYVLTVAVSISAGVAAITSAAQGTSLSWIADHKVIVCLFLIGLIALANLRGVRESGALFAGPTYLFVFSFLFMIGYGLISYYLNPGTTVPPAEDLKFAEGYDLQPLTWFLLLGHFQTVQSRCQGRRQFRTAFPLSNNLNQGTRRRRSDGWQRCWRPCSLARASCRTSTTCIRARVNRNLAVRAHHLHRADGLVLLRHPGSDGPDPGARREHSVCGFSAPFQFTRARSILIPRQFCNAR